MGGQLQKVSERVVKSSRSALVADCLLPAVIVAAPHVVDAPLLLLTSPMLPDINASSTPNADHALLCDSHAKCPRHALRRRRESAAPTPRMPRSWLEETCARFMLETDRIAELE